MLFILNKEIKQKVKKKKIIKINNYIKIRLIFNIN